MDDYDRDTIEIDAQEYLNNEIKKGYFNKLKKWQQTAILGNYIKACGELQKENSCELWSRIRGIVSGFMQAWELHEKLDRSCCKVTQMLNEQGSGHSACLLCGEPLDDDIGE